MKTRTVGTWAGILIAATSLTGCTGSGASGNSYTRPNSGLARTTPLPTAAQPTASAPANASGWNRQPVAAATRTPFDATQVSPNGTSPAMTNQPTAGINPAPGIAPAAPGGTAAPAPGGVTPAGGATSSSLMPASQSMQSINGIAPASATMVKPASMQVATVPMPADISTTRTSLTPPARAAEELPAPPPMPMAVGDMQPPTPQFPTTIGPPPVALPSLPTPAPLPEK
jgi:hypothetical protein